MAFVLSETSNGTGQISFGNTTPFDLQGSAASARLLIRLNAAPATANRIFCKGLVAGSTPSWGVVLVSTSVLRASCYQLGVSNTASGETVLNIGEWYDVLMVFDTAVDAGAGAAIGVYLNGSLEVTSGAVTVKPDTNAIAFTIGKDATSGSNAAPIDVGEFEWIDSQITSAQAVEMYNGGNFKRMSDIGLSPTHYWAMKVGDSVTTIADTIGTGGTKNGTSSTVTDAGDHPTMWYQTATSKPNRNRNHSRDILGRG